MRSKYWTIGPFADWLRGTPSLQAGTSQEWNEWTRSAKAKHPFRYRLAEDGLRWLQNTVMWPSDKLDSARYYINNRWITRTHALTAHPRDIKPGEWRDVGNRFLPCLFNELVDFVEIETAIHHVMWDSEAQKKYIPPSGIFAKFKKRTWRCAEAGIDHLEWASQLTHSAAGAKPGDKNYNAPTGQAVAAREILDLYHWWTQERPHRPEPSDVSGWSDICQRKRDTPGDDCFILDIDDTAAAQKESQKALGVMRKLEQRYENEDEKMMIRLIKIRDHLWT